MCTYLFAGLGIMYQTEVNTAAGLLDLMLLLLNSSAYFDRYHLRLGHHVYQYDTLIIPIKFSKAAATHILIYRRHHWSSNFDEQQIM